MLDRGIARTRAGAGGALDRTTPLAGLVTGDPLRLDQRWAAPRIKLPVLSART